MRRRFPGRSLAASVILLTILAPWARGEEPGQKYAFLVGINRYQHEKLPDLRFAENDVEELARLLTGQGYRVELLTGSAKEPGRQARKANIEKRLVAMLDRCRRGDTVFLAFAGHGLQFEGDRDCYFCPADARPFKSETATLVSLGLVYQKLETSFAGMKILLVDACRDDPDAPRGARGINADQAPRPPQGVAALFSCRAGERAYEHDKFKHGVFFHYVLEGLRGEARNRRNQVTFASLAGYVAQEVAETVPTLVGSGAKQSPNLKADYSVEPVLALAAPVRPVERPVEPVPPKKSESPAPGTHEIKNSIGMRLTYVPPGKFRMGSSAAEVERLNKSVGKFGYFDNEGPEHEVEITQGFYLGTCEVTVEQFAAFVKAKEYRTESVRDGDGAYGYNASLRVLDGRKPEYTWKSTGFTLGLDHPVINVTWNDAVAFCEWLSAEEGKHYQLPTEAQWEYACRAGTSTRFATGDADVSLQGYCNRADQDLRPLLDPARTRIFDFAPWQDSHAFTAPVGSFRANKFGLHDMHGNVFEWCRDWYYDREYQRGNGKDPSGPRAGEQRAYRGGSWLNVASACRSAVRYGAVPAHRSTALGFRVVLSSER